VRLAQGGASGGIGIRNDTAEPFENLCDGALARSDTAGKADDWSIDDFRLTIFDF
jgi:hypothetical protein